MLAGNRAHQRAAAPDVLGPWAGTGVSCGGAPGGRSGAHVVDVVQAAALGQGGHLLHLPRQLAVCPGAVEAPVLHTARRQACSARRARCAGSQALQGGLSGVQGRMRRAEAPCQLEAAASPPPAPGMLALVSSTAGVCHAVRPLGRQATDPCPGNHSKHKHPAHRLAGESAPGLPRSPQALPQSPAGESGAAGIARLQPCWVGAQGRAHLVVRPASGAAPASAASIPAAAAASAVPAATAPPEWGPVPLGGTTCAAAAGWRQQGEVPEGSAGVGLPAGNRPVVGTSAGDMVGPVMQWSGTCLRAALRAPPCAGRAPCGAAHAPRGAAPCERPCPRGAWTGQRWRWSALPPRPAAHTLPQCVSRPRWQPSTPTRGALHGSACTSSGSLHHRALVQTLSRAALDRCCRW